MESIRQTKKDEIRSGIFKISKLFEQEQKPFFNSTFQNKK